jgi:hypothetical protein
MNDYISSPCNSPSSTGFATSNGGRPLLQVFARIPKDTDTENWSILDTSVLAGLPGQPNQPDPIAELIGLFVEDGDQRLNK